MSETTTGATTKPEPTWLYRWLVLVFISLAMFGNMHDCISPLADVLKEQLARTRASACCRGFTAS
jgi:hypothetical protein